MIDAMMVPAFPRTDETVIAHAGAVSHPIHSSYYLVLVIAFDFSHAVYMCKCVFIVLYPLAPSTCCPIVSRNDQAVVYFPPVYMHHPAKIDTPQLAMNKGGTGGSSPHPPLRTEIEA